MVCMPRLRKVHPHGYVAFITTSTEDGLPFPPNPMMKAVIESALARAQFHHPVRVCHYLIESNHIHLIVIIDNPDDLNSFMERFKTESAHAVNRLLGIKKRTVWCEGYDSPLLLTVRDVIREIVYTYTNPTKDNLEDSLEKYPGLSSWAAYKTGRHKKLCPWIHRDDLFPLKHTSLTLSHFDALARRLKHRASEEYPFEVHPDAWMESFGITDPEKKKRINQIVVKLVRAREAKYRRRRAAQGKSVIGARRLMLQPMDCEYHPERSGRRMWCVCGDQRVRKIFIRAVKVKVNEADEVYELWKVGDFSRPFPAGLFPPSMPKLVEPLDIL